MAMVLTPNREEALVQRKEMSSLFSPSSFPITPSPSSLISPSSFPITPSPSSLISPSLSESIMVDESIQNAESIITKWDPNSSSQTHLTSLFHHDRDEAKEFVQSVNNLRGAMHFLVAQSAANNKPALALAQKLMQMAMKRLEKELYHILSTSRTHQEPGSVSGESSDFEDENETEPKIKTEKVPEVVMSDLKLIVDCMISCGYRRECVKIYNVIRKSVVDEGIYGLGIERYRSSHLHKLKTEALDRTITTWLSAIKTAVRTIFNKERVLCDHVFAASEATRETCFVEITKEGATNLFRFPELVAKGKQSQERIFQLMELHEALSDIYPDIDLIFSIESTSSIKSQANTSLLKIGEAVLAILFEFEAKIQKDSSKTPVPNGGIHPLTLSVMSYISSLGDYGGVLSDIVANHPPSGTLQLPESYIESPPPDNGTASALSLHLARLFLVLLCKLDSKTGMFKDVSLSYLFLANNLQFIVDRVHTTKLRFILGDDWIFSHAKKVVQYASSYQLMAWTKVFSSFPYNDSLMVVTPEAARECFRNFNAAFEEAYRKQTSWIVPDGKLRDEIKVSITKNLVPAYQEFYDTYLDALSGEENLAVIVKFAPDDLENYLSDLFHGTSISGSSTSSSPHSYPHLQGCLPR